jgi:hypothetical protein
MARMPKIMGCDFVFTRADGEIVAEIISDDPTDRDSPRWLHIIDGDVWPVSDLDDAKQLAVRLLTGDKNATVSANSEPTFDCSRSSAG